MAGRCCSDARATQLAACFGLVVGAAWGALAIAALAASGCAFPAPDHSLFWLLYFFEPACGRAAPEFLQRLAPGWPGERTLEGVRRTRAFAATRLALALARVATSTALLVVERRQRVAWTRGHGRSMPRYFSVYFCWLLVALFDVVVDAVLIPHYAPDITHAKGAHNVQRLLEVSASSAAWAAALPEWVARAPALPPSVMLVVGARAALLLWPFEIVAVARVAARARILHQRRRLARNREAQERTPRQQTAAETATASTASASPGRERGPQRAEAPSTSSEDEIPHSAATDDAPSTSTRSGLGGLVGLRGSWRRASLLDRLPLPGAGERRWSYVPLSTQPSPPPPPSADRQRPSSHAHDPAP